MKKYVGLVACCLLLVLVLAACGTESTNGDSQLTPSNDPVTVSMLMPKWAFTDEEYETLVVEPVVQKHPHISFERTIANINVKALQETVTKGIYPDIIITSSNILDPLHDMKFSADIEPVLKGNGFDVSRLKSGGLEAIKTGSAGELIAIPYSQNFSALYYNKDIFDKFAVSYPKEGITWDEAIALARDLTRMDGGVQYHGLHPGKLTRTASQLELGTVDPKSLKAIVNSDGWKRNFQLHQSIFSIPGNAFFPEGQAYDRLIKDQTLAMMASNNLFGRLSNAPDLNWDMTTYPYFSDRAGIGINYDLHIMAITADSKNKDAAFKAIESVVSDDVQKKMTRSGRVTVLDNEKINEEFGKDLAFLAGKNIDAIFKTTPAANISPTPFDVIAEEHINGKPYNDVIQNGIDINTALRQAEEEINQLIETNSK